MNRLTTITIALLLALAARVCPAATHADTVATIGIDLHNSPVDAVFIDSIAYVHYPSGLVVVNIASPRDPDSLLSFSLPGEGGDIEMRNNHIYLSRGDEGLFTYDVSNPLVPVPVDTMATPGALGRMDIMGQRLFALDDSGMVSILLNPAADPSVIGRFNLSAQIGLSDILAQDNVAYIASERVGLILLDITNNIVTDIPDFELEGAVALELYEGLLYVATGPGGLVTVDVSDPQAPDFGPDSYSNGDTITALTLVDSLIVASIGTMRLGIFDRDDISIGPSDDAQTERNPSRLKSHEGNVFAMMTSGGLGIIDVIEPDGTAFISQFDSDGAIIQSLSLYGDTLFAPAGAEGVFILSIADPENVDTIGYLEVPDTSFASDVVAIDTVLCVAEGGKGVGIYRRFGGEELAHFSLDGTSISLQASGNVLYVCYGAAGLLTVDLSDPTNPILADTLAPAGSSGNVQRAVIKDELLLITEGSEGLGILDISDPLHPVRQGSWRGDGPVVDVALWGENTALALLALGDLVSLDIAVPTSPTPLDTLSIDVVFLRSIGVSGDLAYLMEWQGFDKPGIGHLVSVNDPSSLERVGEFSTVGPASDIIFSGDLILLPVETVGLEIYTTFEEFSVVPVGEYTMSNRITVVATSAQRMLTGDNEGMIQSFVVFPGDSLARRASIRIDGEITEMVTDDERAFAITAEGRIAQLDVSNSFRIDLVRYIDEVGTARGLFLADSLLYIAAADKGLFIYDISQPDSIVLIGEFLQGTGAGDPNLFFDRALRVLVQDNVAYVVTRSQEQALYLIDVSEPDNPSYLGAWGDSNDRIFDVAVYQGVAYLAKREVKGLVVVDVSTPTAPSLMFPLASPSNGFRLEAADGILFVADRTEGISFLDISNPNAISELYRDDTPGSVRDLGLFGTYLTVSDNSSMRVYLQSFANIDEVAPSYGISILHNTYLNAYVDFVVVASEVLTSLPAIRLEMGDVDSVLTSLKLDFQRNIYHATYRLASIGTGRVIVEGEDLAGNKSEATKNFSVSEVRGAKGGTISSGDGKIEVVVPPGSPSQNSYISLVSVDPSEFDRSSIPPFEVAEGPYRLSLGGVSRPSAINWSGIGPGEGGEAPVLYRLEKSGWVALPARFDPETESIQGELPGSSTFLISYHGGGPIGLPPFSIGMDQNRPNPFNPVTAIDFHLSRRAAVTLSIYDVTGRLVRTLVDGELPPGSQTVLWNGKDRAGRASPSGVYFSRMEAEKQIRTRKLILIR